MTTFASTCQGRDQTLERDKQRWDKNQSKSMRKVKKGEDPAVCILTTNLKLCSLVARVDLKSTYKGELPSCNQVQGGLPLYFNHYRICLQCRRPGFYPWVGKIPWRRKWQPTSVFLPGELEEPCKLQSMG